MNKPLQKYSQTFTLVIQVDSKNLRDEKFTFQHKLGSSIKYVRRYGNGMGSHDESVQVRSGGGGSNLVSTYAFRLYIFRFGRFSR